VATPSQSRATNKCLLCQPDTDMIEIVLIVVVIMASACDIVWIPNHEGLFSQFLQLRVIVRVVADFNATSFCTAPVLTVHFNNTPTSSCDVGPVLRER
jgi:hypothetical protein